MVLRRRSLLVTFAFLAILLAVAPTPSPTAPRVADGRWGGVGIALDVTASGARIELDCAHGTIDTTLSLDAEGRFDAPGRLVRERPGPVRMDEDDTADQGEAVRYTGRVEGETLTLLVVRPNPPRPPNPLTAGLGKSPRLRKCN
jgi:hypothetical protein